MKAIPVGTVHNHMPRDLKKALVGDKSALQTWSEITPLARNEWICWIETAKMAETRKRRIERTPTELAKGIRRPCCWPGCNHRARGTQ